MVVEVNVRKKIELDHLIDAISRKLDKIGGKRYIEILDEHAAELLLVCQYVNEEISKSERKE